MYNPSIWSAELSEGRRQYVASILKNCAGKPIHMTMLASIVGMVANEPVPDEVKTNKRMFHSTNYRRLLSGDIDALNCDMRFPFVIISDNKGVRLGNRADVEQFCKAEHKEAVKKLAKVSKIARKAGLDGQTVLVTAEEIKSFVEGENETA